MGLVDTHTFCNVLLQVILSSHLMHYVTCIFFLLFLIISVSFLLSVSREPGTYSYLSYPCNLNCVKTKTNIKNVAGIEVHVAGM